MSCRKICKVSVLSNCPLNTLTCLIIHISGAVDINLEPEYLLGPKTTDPLIAQPLSSNEVPLFLG